MKKVHPAPTSSEERELGMHCTVKRRDFLGAALIGSGAALLNQVAPAFAAAAAPGGDARPLPAGQPASAEEFDGYSGVGDYAHSNGNTYAVIADAHRVRDGIYQDLSGARDTGETFDMVTVGAGPAAIGSAYYFQRATGGKRSCLLLDNHPMFGGEAKGNEIDVAGTRLMGPQGSNTYFMPTPGDTAHLYDEFVDIGVPLAYPHAELHNSSKALEFDRTNYMHMYPSPISDSVAWFNTGATTGSPWARNAFGNRFQGTEYPAHAREQLTRWFHASHRPEMSDAAFEDLVNTTSYEDYLTRVLKLDPLVARFCDPLLGTVVGLGASSCSATAARTMFLPGFRRKDEQEDRRLVQVLEAERAYSFPYGNGYLARYFVKHLIPQSITGQRSPEDVGTAPVRFEALDVPGAPTRLRTSSTVLRVAHEGSQFVRVTYVRAGQLHSVRARCVVACGGGWINKHILHDMPQSHREAYARFMHAPQLVVNVALRNWRFMEKLGVTACQWRGGDFGIACNVRRPVHLGGYQPPLDPDKPIMLTFYVPFVYPGLAPRTQGAQGRFELLSTSFREYEQKIRRQLVRMFSASGFDPTRDIEAIVLNRWGHAYVVPEPGTFTGAAGTTTPADVLRQRFGRVAIAHAELHGGQAFRFAMMEAKRAVDSLLSVV